MSTNHQLSLAYLRRIWYLSYLSNFIPFVDTTKSRGRRRIARLQSPTRTRRVSITHAYFYSRAGARTNIIGRFVGWLVCWFVCAVLSFFLIGVVWTILKHVHEGKVMSLHKIRCDTRHIVDLEYDSRSILKSVRSRQVTRWKKVRLETLMGRWKVQKRQSNLVSISAWPAVNLLINDRMTSCHWCVQSRCRYCGLPWPVSLATVFINYCITTRNNKNDSIVHYLIFRDIEIVHGRHSGQFRGFRRTFHLYCVWSARLQLWMKEELKRYNSSSPWVAVVICDEYGSLRRFVSLQWSDVLLVEKVPNGMECSRFKITLLSHQRLN